MKKIIEIVTRIDSTCLFKIIERLLKTSEYQQFIAELNRKRLRERGEYVNGKKISTFASFASHVYSIFTIIKKGERSGTAGVTSHVTAYDTGGFHKSFALKVEKTFAEVVADEQKLALLSENINIEGLLGLTTDDKQILLFKLKPDVLREYKFKIAV